MSALGFQKALAQLIRYPDQEVSQVILYCEGELSARERDALVSAAKDPLIVKYARKMQLVRHREATGILRFSKNVIPADLLNSLYFNHFEPRRKTTDSLWLGVEFLELILSEPACLEALCVQAPRWGTDCIKYECAKAHVVRQIPADSDPSLPAGSLLRYGAFRIIELEFDIPHLELHWVETGEVPTEPVQRHLTLLFIPSHASPFYRMFEIDAEVAMFLTCQREKPSDWTNPLPSSYEGMQAAGLVQ